MLSVRTACRVYCIRALLHTRWWYAYCVYESHRFDFVCRLFVFVHRGSARRCLPADSSLLFTENANQYCFGFLFSWKNENETKRFLRWNQTQRYTCTHTYNQAEWFCRLHAFASFLVFIRPIDWEKCALCQSIDWQTWFFSSTNFWRYFFPARSQISWNRDCMIFSHLCLRKKAKSTHSIDCYQRACMTRHQNAERKKSSRQKKKQCHRV